MRCVFFPRGSTIATCLRRLKSGTWYRGEMKIEADLVSPSILPLLEWHNGTTTIWACCSMGAHVLARIPKNIQKVFCVDKYCGERTLSCQGIKLPDAYFESREKQGFWPSNSKVFQWKWWNLRQRQKEILPPQNASRFLKLFIEDIILNDSRSVSLCEIWAVANKTE